MTQHAMEKPGKPTMDALGQVRAATQELHRAINGTLAKGASATKAEVESLAKRVKDAADAARLAMRSQDEAEQRGAIKQQLTDAVEKLDAAHKHATETILSRFVRIHKVFSCT